MSGGGRRTFFHCRGANAEFTPADLDGVDLPARFFYLGYLLLLDALDTDDPEYGTAAARLLETMRRAGFASSASRMSASSTKLSAANKSLPVIFISVSFPFKNSDNSFNKNVLTKKKNVLRF